MMDDTSIPGFWYAHSVTASGQGYWSMVNLMPIRRGSCVQSAGPFFLRSMTKYLEVSWSKVSTST